jgi:hypothetical protein
MDILDKELILKFTGWEAFDPLNWNDIMNLLGKIEESQKNYSVWAEITPSTTRISNEKRDSNGVRIRGEDGFFIPMEFIQKSNKERNKKKHIVEACVEYLKSKI